MDVKSAFLNGKISKEAYVEQTPRFESREFPNHVCKLNKALYGLKQAPRAWYETLSEFLTRHKFVRGAIDDTLFTYKTQSDVIIVQIYVDDIIFGSTRVKLSKQFAKLMTTKYEMASRLDIQFSTCLCARYQANSKESHLVAVKRIFRKSTSGGCQILRGKLVCWSAKKQTSVAMSSAEAKYVAAAGCCSRVLWIKSQLADYDVLYDKVSIFCDNTSAIAISNNPVLHSGAKHIDIRYHLIRDHILKGDIEIHFVPTNMQLADIFTKPLAEPSFTRLVAEMGMLNIEKQATEELVVIVDPLQSIETSESAEVPEKIVKMEEVAEEQSLEIPTVEQLLDKANKLNKVVQETPERFEVADSDDTYDNEVSQSDHISQEDNTSAERLSLPNHMDHICEEFSSLHSKLRDMESSIVQPVFAEIKLSLPALVITALKEQLHGLLSATLKDCLPLIIKESLQTHIPAASKQFAEKQTKLNKKVVKHLNKQFNISHVAQSNRFVTLQKELSKVLKSELAKSVTEKGVHQTAENITPSKPTAETQGKLAYKESTLPVFEMKVNKETAMVLHDSEKKDLVDITTTDLNNNNRQLNSSLISCLEPLLQNSHMLLSENQPLSEILPKAKKLPLKNLKIN
ncbi:retrovirus-related pol polyprotein from transposon TNT 1-94 [Tanacetum coccineum]